MNSHKPSTADALRLITTHQSALLAFILTLHRSYADAQDILQETNVVLWEKIEEFEPGSNFKSWAFRIAYLQTLAFFKRNQRGSWLGFSSDLVEILAREAEPLLDDFEQRQEALRHCIGQLTESDRALLRAYYFGGRALAEIGANMQKSVGSLKQVLLRIRRSLKQCIEGQIAVRGEHHG